MTVALVTGASRGIGRAIAIELGEKGHTVGVNYRTNAELANDVAREIERSGGAALCLQADVSDPAAVAGMFRELAAGPGLPEILICNAGITNDTLLGSSTPDDFESVLRVNLFGVVNCCREALRGMLSRRRGAIVLISSAAAQRPGRGQSNYAASKGAIESFTRAMAVELAPRGIRVNAVAPGLVETQMTEELRALARQELLAKILLRRFGQPRDVAKVVSFLASDDAGYVTGQVWNVDGGFKLE